MKNKFKRIFMLAMVAVLFITHIPYSTLAEAAPAKLKVVSTIFPQYDFVRQIAGDNVELSQLLKPGADSHAYELTPQDVKAIQESDLFIYVGGPEDHKFDELLESLGDKAPKTAKLIDYVEVVNEEIVEGMQHEHHHHDHDHEHEDHEHHHHHHHDEESITKDDVEDRGLTEFAGAYQSMHQFYENGTLDDLVEQIAKKNDKTAEEVREFQIKNLYTPFNNIEITADGIKAVENGEAKEESKYSYDGFDFEDHGGHAHVWYKFVKADDNTSLPKYILINDHGYKANQEKSEDHIPHMHFGYSNESYEKALEQESPMALYITSALSAEEIHDILMSNHKEHEDHDHEHHEHEHEEHDDHDHEHEGCSCGESKDGACNCSGNDEGKCNCENCEHENGKCSCSEDHEHEHEEHEHHEHEDHEHEHEGCNCGENKDGACNCSGNDEGKCNCENCEHENGKCSCSEDHEHEHEEHEHHEHEDHEHEHHHHHHDEIDEHVWTDPQNAIKIVRGLADLLGEMDEANKDLYKNNAENYVKELEAIDQELANVVKNAKRDTILVGDRFPFRYLVDRYGLHYFAAFSGCSADTEVAAGTVKFLIDKVMEEKLPVVFKIELSNGQIASTIAEGTGAKILTLNSAHNLTAEEAAAGKTFVDIMRENIKALEEALN